MSPQVLSLPSWQSVSKPQEDDEKRVIISIFKDAGILEKEMRDATRTRMETGEDGKVEELFLGYCMKLMVLSSQIGKLPKLTKLSLFGCKQLITLPQEIGQLFNVRKLDLGRCENLTTLPSEIGNLHCLATLDLDGCVQLKELPHEIGNMKRLTELNLFGCKKLTSLPPEVGKLSRLTELDLRFCKELTALPPEIGHLYQLTYLNIFHCDRLTIPPSDLKFDDEVIQFMRDLLLLRDKPLSALDKIRHEPRLLSAAAQDPAFSSSLGKIFQVDQSLSELVNWKRSSQPCMEEQEYDESMSSE